MDLPHFSRREAAFIIGLPIAWAVLLLFHPGGEADDIYGNVQGNVTETLVVHIGMMIFVPLFAIVIWLLLRGIESTAATVARVALIPYVVLYVAWEALQGTANGVLVDEASSLSAAEQETAANLIQDFAESPLVRDAGVLVIPATLALVVALVALGLALRDRGAPGWSPAVFGVTGFLIAAHPPPYGPTGLVLFAVAVLFLMRSQHLVDEPTPHPVPP